MGIGDFADKAKDMLSGHEDQVSDGLDKGGDMLKDKLPDEHDGKVDSAVDKAQDFLEQNKNRD